MSGAVAGHELDVMRCAPANRLFAQITWVKESVDLKLPAEVLVLDTGRAAASKPQRRAVGSVIVTTQCWTTAGAYVLPPKSVETFPPLLLTAPVPWHWAQTRVRPGRLRVYGKRSNQAGQQTDRAYESCEAHSV
jgi:hypothetical protein